MRRRVRAEPVRSRSEPESPQEHPLAGLPNTPSPITKTKTIGDINAGINAAEWGRRLKAGESMVPLYADNATQIGNAGLRDVEGTDEQHITRALTVDRIKPGLNLVSRGISKGRVYYIEDDGQQGLRAGHPAPRAGARQPQPDGRRLAAEVARRRRQGRLPDLARHPADAQADRQLIGERLRQRRGARPPRGLHHGLPARTSRPRPSSASSR